MIGFLFVSGLILLPPILFAMAPRPFLPAAVGWAALGIGIGWLQERNVPFSELGMFGSGTWLFTSWAIVLGVATFFRVTSMSHYSPEAATGRETYRQFSLWLGRQLPIGLLLAIFFMHWLRNRMAGFEPAWLAHILLFLPAALGALALVGWIVRGPLREGLPQAWDARPLIAAFLVGIAGIVFANGSAASSHHAEALKKADGQPFCMLTFAGRNRARQADAILELSPLVSRWGGEGFERFGPHWLFIDESALSFAELTPDPDEGVWHRDGNTLYRDVKIRPERPRPIEQGSMPCKPSYDGGMQGL